MEDEVGQFVIGKENLDRRIASPAKPLDLKGEQHRRSLYVQVRRSRKMLSFLDAFDAPRWSPTAPSAPSPPWPRRR